MLNGPCRIHAKEPASASPLPGLSRRGTSRTITEESPEFFFACRRVCLDDNHPSRNDDPGVARPKARKEFEDVVNFRNVMCPGWEARNEWALPRISAGISVPMGGAL